MEKRCLTHPPRERERIPVMPTSLRFYFDYISPNAYLAWTQLPALAARHDVTIVPIPVLFAALLAAHGQLGPAETPAKMRWMVRNNLRKASLLGVPLNPPQFHPFNPLLVLRVSSLPLDAATRRTLIDAFFRAVWVDGRHVSDPDTVVRVIQSVGLDGPALLDWAQHAENKARVRQQTDDAIACGIFGVPTVQAGDELFWGFDDFPHLERFLAGADPLDPTALARWADRQPSAVRTARKAPAPS
jgi:2-hydroxychromene-2-carboxylate isomerase